MNTGRTILSQILDFIPRYEFKKFIDNYNGNYRVKSFTCWEQFIVMCFAQLTSRESLRDIEVCLGAIPTRLYHSGLKSQIKRSTLSEANSNRDWRIYAEFSQILIQQARDLYSVWKKTLIFHFFVKNSPGSSKIFRKKRHAFFD